MDGYQPLQHFTSFFGLSLRTVTVVHIEVLSRVSYGIPPPPPRNFEIEYGYYCGAINISYLTLHVTGHKYVPSNVVWKACPRLRQKQSERI